MVVVADALGAWLVGLLADAGRKKLTTLILGTDQERALRSAATAAVLLTAEELRPDDAEQAEHLALVISQVFDELTSKPPTSVALATHHALSTYPSINFTFTATGYPPPTFTVSSGTLPAGLTLDPASGLISGTPTKAGSYTFTVTASNGVGSVTSPSVNFLIL